MVGASPGRAPRPKLTPSPELAAREALLDASQRVSVAELAATTGISRQVINRMLARARARRTALQEPDSPWTFGSGHTPLRHEHLFAYAPVMSQSDSAQRAVLGVLLQAHPRLLGMDELDAQLADVPSFREALKVLTADGLATRLGDRVGVSRAAVRFDALGPL
jgi:hypothetical protein